MIKIKVVITFVALLVPSLFFAQQLVHKPINPFFGGDTFNYQQLLASANAQNDFQEDNGFDFEQPSSLDNFTESLNRQLLNSLSQELFQEQIGDQSLSTGTFVFGSLVVEVIPTSGGLSVTILDTSTGEQTQIIIPNN